MPPGAPPLDAATLEIGNPDTHAPIVCSGNHDVAADLGRRPTNKISLFPASEAARIADIERAVAAYTAASPVFNAAVRPREPQPDCVKRYVSAATRRAVEPPYPELARQQGHTGMATVAIELDATGAELSTELFRTTGYL